MDVIVGPGLVRVPPTAATPAARNWGPLISGVRPVPRGMDRRRDPRPRDRRSAIPRRRLSIENAQADWILQSIG
jgi:hypothetical protein